MPTYPAAEKRYVIEIIDHAQQRYPTAGDWQPGKHGRINISVSRMRNWRYELLVAVHELIEASLCQHKGVSAKDVDAFDMAYERRRKPGDDSEPGDDPKAPYHHQHQAAMTVETFLAAQLGIDWPEYEKTLQKL